MFILRSTRASDPLEAKEYERRPAHNVNDGSGEHHTVL
jgi:hypothetical protein